MVIVGYALGLLLVAAVLFTVAAVIFGRGEETPPLETGSTPTVLPEEDVVGEDVRALRFQQVVRGYKPAEVDWALARLANEIDALRAELAAGDGGGVEPVDADGAGGADAPGSDGADAYGTGVDDAAVSSAADTRERTHADERVGTADATPADHRVD